MKRARRKEIKQKSDRALGYVFAGLLLLFVIAHIVLPDRSLSEEENRSLAGRPAVSASRLVNGTFMTQTENYLSDQFPARSLWRRFTVLFDRIGGSREENGVLLGKGGQLMEVPAEEDAIRLAASIDGIHSFVRDNPSVRTSVIIVPDAAVIYPEKLPALTDIPDQQEQIRKIYSLLDPAIHAVDAEGILRAHADEKIYYETDHHWTTSAAFYVATDYASGAGLLPAADSPGTMMTVTEHYNGSLSSLSGFRPSAQESIQVWFPDSEETVLVSYVEEQEIRTSLYDTSWLDAKDKYSLFLGGNHPLINISTARGTGRTLLLVKDSFANCFVPFLTPLFDRIVIVDPRYYTGSIRDVLRSYSFTDALFLYGAATFVTDHSLGGFLSATE